MNSIVLYHFIDRDILDEPVQGTTPVNGNNMSAVGRQASLYDEPAMFLTKAEIKTMFKRERRRASTACIT